MTALRKGFTTGACAAAAARAAAGLLCGMLSTENVEITLPDGERTGIPLAFARLTEEGAEAGVLKDAGDDPDVTHGAMVIARVEWIPGDGIEYAAGDGVGTVTLPGLAVPPGEPAINPGPRSMIARAIREVTPRGALVTVSIPGGRELAKKTFNPRLGIAGGLSVLGTTGRVRPFSIRAMRESLARALDVAVACGIKEPVFVPGNIGSRAAERHLSAVNRQVIEVGNEWGFMLDRAASCGVARLLALGHPGKLAKLWQGGWDTHSSRSEPAAPAVAGLARELTGRDINDCHTVESIFASLTSADRGSLAGEIARRVRKSISNRVRRKFDVSVALIDLSGEWLGHSGEIGGWRKSQ